MVPHMVPIFPKPAWAAALRRNAEPADQRTRHRRRAAWVPAELPGLGRGTDEHTWRSGRGRARSFRYATPPRWPTRAVIFFERRRRLMDDGQPTSVEQTGRCGMTTGTGRYGQECCQPCSPRPDNHPKLFRSSGRPSRTPLVRDKSFRYQADSWTTPRRIVAKVEHHVGELFPRVGFTATNIAPRNRAVVRFYNKRGTAEQWIREGKQAAHWTRLSCHRFRANSVRLQLSALAHNLGNGWGSGEARALLLVPAG